MDTIKKIINFEVKQVGPESDRVLRFCGSDETVDRDNDIMEVAGWKTEDYMKNPVFLWAHNGYSTPPIGKCVNCSIDLARKKLIFDIKFPTLEELSSDIENPAEHAKFADMIYNMYRKGYMNATSVGFRGIKYKTRDDPEVLEKPEWQRGRRYIEQNLLELSAVPVPSNPNALQLAKSEGLVNETQIKSFFMPKELKEVELMADSNTKEIFVMENGQRIAKARVSEPYLSLLFEEKAGASISAKNKQTIKQACEQLMSAHESLTGMMEPDEEEPEEEPKTLFPVVVDYYNEIVSIKTDDGLVNSFTFELLKDIDSERVKEFKKIISTKSTDAPKVVSIDLAAIDSPKTEPKAVNDELPIKPEEIKSMIENMFEKKLNAAMGRID